MATQKLGIFLSEKKKQDPQLVSTKIGIQDQSDVGEEGQDSLESQLDDVMLDGITRCRAA
jgi:hypothetical protein